MNVALLGLLALGAAGCGREETTVYRVPKETAPASVAGAGMPHGVPAEPNLHWTLPAGWAELPPSGMSLARFAPAETNGPPWEVSVLSLPGAGDKELEVLNIFRDRLRLAPLDAAARQALAQTVAVGPGQGRLYDMGPDAAGATNPVSRMLVAVLSQGDQSWYFRLTGADAAVEAQRGAYLEFLKSVAVHAGEGAPAVATPAPSASVPAASGPALPTWEVPGGWQAAPPTSMVLARFLAAGEGGPVEIAVSVFPGDVGGLVANINRWRGQVGLGALDEAGARQQGVALEHPEGPGTLVDMTGEREGKPFRLIGVILPREGRTWFYKLLGDEAAAGREKEALIRFVKSARHPHA